MLLAPERFIWFLIWKQDLEILINLANLTSLFLSRAWMLKSNFRATLFIDRKTGKAKETRVQESQDEGCVRPEINWSLWEINFKQRWTQLNLDSAVDSKNVLNWIGDAIILENIWKFLRPLNERLRPNLVEKLSNDFLEISVNSSVFCALAWSLWKLVERFSSLLKFRCLSGFPSKFMQAERSVKTMLDGRTYLVNEHQLKGQLYGVS